MNARGKMAIRWLTVAYVGLLTAGSLLPSGTGPLRGWDATLTPSVQNVLHVPAYAGLVLLTGIAFGATGPRTVGGIVPVMLACSAWGAILEIAQAGIPGRTASLSDGLLNMAGAATGSVILWLVARRARRVSLFWQSHRANAEAGESRGK